MLITMLVAKCKGWSCHLMYMNMDQIRHRLCPLPVKHPRPLLPPVMSDQTCSRLTVWVTAAHTAGDSVVSKSHHASTHPSIHVFILASIHPLARSLNPLLNHSPSLTQASAAVQSIMKDMPKEKQRQPKILITCRLEMSVTRPRH